MEVKARTLGICLEYLRVLFARGNVRTNYAIERNTARVNEAIAPLRKTLQESSESAELKRISEMLVNIDKQLKKAGADDVEKLEQVKKDLQTEFTKARTAADVKTAEVNDMSIAFEPYRIKLEHLPETFGPKTIGSTVLDADALDHENKIYNDMIFSILGPVSLDTVFEFLRKDLDLIEE